MLLGPAEGAPLSEWQQMVELNVLGLLYCAHAALPISSRRPRRARAGGRHGRTSARVAGRVPRSGSGVYNLTNMASAHSARRYAKR